MYFTILLMASLISSNIQNALRDVCYISNLTQTSSPDTLEWQVIDLAMSSILSMWVFP